ncbi:Hypothetical protein HDN1F_25480 [gamma proteobacterium HdN1]|nr:Hypothetical protein HDN1F_25480 [gamma proteobacterium HdN1]
MGVGRTRAEGAIGVRFLPYRLFICLALWLSASFLSNVYALDSLAKPPAPQVLLPLEQNGYTRISHSFEVSRYLQFLARTYPEARYETLGKSVQGRVVDALIVARNTVSARDRAADDRAANNPTPTHITVMLVGGQHGAAEPATTEAMLSIAKEVLSGDLNFLLDTITLILIPNVNPDGRDLGYRSNANHVNINTDFVRLEQPESQVLVDALNHFQPDVVLDSHESAVLKVKSLAKQGFLTDFYAQFEGANNPALPTMTRQWLTEQILPELIQRTTRQGLPANRYIGEITSIHQPITDGGLTVRNFRNRVGLSGVLSFLLETRLDSKLGDYPSYRNIRARVQRQLVCLRIFLEVVHAQREAFKAQVLALRTAEVTEPQSVRLSARYVLDKRHPQVAIPLRRLDDQQLQTLIFADHRALHFGPSLQVPRYYAVTAHQQKIAEYLQKNHIRYDVLTSPREVDAEINQYRRSQGAEATLAKSRRELRRIAAGSLWVDLSQPLARLAMVLLDPRSSSSVFLAPDYAPLWAPDQDFFILAVP